VANDALVRHLVDNALRTDGPFTLRSGAISDWYLDARQTTFDGRGARLAGEAVLDILNRDVAAVGGMTMGADPIAVACAMVAAVEAATYLLDAGFQVLQAIALVDRSNGKAREAFAALGIEHEAIVTPKDLGVAE
jgi:orotate phosphoribosyltransferase